MGKGVCGDITLKKLKITITIQVVIFIVLLVVKLTVHNDWLWYYVTVPMWCGIPVALGITGLVNLAISLGTKND